MQKEKTDAVEPFQKLGKVLDDAEYQNIADSSSEAVESAIATLRKAGFNKAVELIEATDNETQPTNNPR